MNSVDPPPLPSHSKGVPVAVWLGCGGCAVLSLFLILLVGGIFFAVLSSIRKTEPFQHTLAAAKASPELREALGEPIHLGWYFTGSFNWNNGDGAANGHIPISGPKDSAFVHVIGAKKVGEPWVFEKMDAEIQSTHQIIRLVSPTDLPTQADE